MKIWVREKLGKDAWFLTRRFQCLPIRASNVVHG